MKTSITTWNVNSIRQRINHLKHMNMKFNPDVIILQEIKCEISTFPIIDIGDLGYTSIINGQKSYNGTALLTKLDSELITNVLPGFENQSSRFQEIYIKIPDGRKIRVINIYAPQGQEMHSSSFESKMKFYDCLYLHLKQLIKIDEQILLAGDFNIAYAPIDVYNHIKMKDKIGFHITEREKLRKIYNLGMIDIFRLLNQNEREFTWWDYRKMGFEHNKGMRIDMILLSPKLAESASACKILTEFRSMNKPSDHVPVSVYFE